MGQADSGVVLYVSSVIKNKRPRQVAGINQEDQKNRKGCQRHPEGKIQNEPDVEKRLLLAAVHHLDDAIGKIIKTLEEEGKLENTLILFSSDNGPQVKWAGDGLEAISIIGEFVSVFQDSYG